MCSKKRLKENNSVFKYCLSSELTNEELFELDKKKPLVLVKDSESLFKAIEKQAWDRSFG